MDSIINSALAGFPGTSVGKVAGQDALPSNRGGLAASLADQDWFSAQTLDDGQTILTGHFDNTANRLSVEQAAEKIIGRLFSSPDRT